MADELFAATHERRMQKAEQTIFDLVRKPEVIPPTKLSQLTGDVDIRYGDPSNKPNDGDTIIWDEAAKMWKPGPQAGGGATATWGGYVARDSSGATITESWKLPSLGEFTIGAGSGAGAQAEVVKVHTAGVWLVTAAAETYSSALVNVEVGSSPWRWPGDAPSTCRYNRAQLKAADQYGTVSSHFMMPLDGFLYVKPTTGDSEIFLSVHLVYPADIQLGDCG